MTSPTNQTIFSGVKPSAAALHIGNYLGALKQWVALQADNQTYYCIVDLHAITVPYDPQALAERTLNIAALYLASGLDPNNNIIFVQSHVPAHTELTWLLGCHTPYGELTRMTQFKDKAQKQNVTFGLFAYPILMAADVLLYQANLVPVGEDQMQHIELTRDIAKRFNNRFGDTFTIPQVFSNPATTRVMSLADATQKMGKSEADNKGTIWLTDEPNTIRQKVMSAATETETTFSFTASGPAVQNLLRIYQAFGEEPTKVIEQKFAGAGYKEFKEALTELIIDKLTPIREKYTALRQDEKALTQILATGADQAAQVANQTLHNVKEKMSLA